LMLETGTLPALTSAATDSEAEVRGACLLALRELAKHRECTVPIVQEGFVKLFIDRCVSAPDGGPPTPEFQASALKALGRVCQTDDGLKEAIKVGAVKVTVDMLGNEDFDVRGSAAFCLSALVYGQEEKAVALQHGIMAKAVAMLGEHDVELQTAAAAMLMSMCNGTKFQPNDPRVEEFGENACKAEAVKVGACLKLAPLLQPGLELERRGDLTEENSALTVYVTKAMASLADAPKGRKQLKEIALEDLKILALSSEPLVQKNAMIAVERVTWTP